MANISTEEFDNRLSAKLQEITGEQLLFYIPSIFDEVSEFFNNEIIDEWEQEQEADHD